MAFTDYKVVWDIDEVEDGVEISVPEVVSVPDDIEDDDIADWISDKYGFCILELSPCPLNTKPPSEPNWKELYGKKVQELHLEQEANKILEEENKKLKDFSNWENHPALKHKVVLDDDYYLEHLEDGELIDPETFSLLKEENKKLKEENEQLKQTAHTNFHQFDSLMEENKKLQEINQSFTSDTAAADAAKNEVVKLLVGDIVKDHEKTIKKLKDELRAENDTINEKLAHQSETMSGIIADLEEQVKKKEKEIDDILKFISGNFHYEEAVKDVIKRYFTMEFIEGNEERWQEVGLEFDEE